MALTPAERYARHKAKKKEQMLEMIRTGKPLPPTKKFTEAQLTVRRSQLAKRMKEKQEMIEEKMRKGEPVHIPMTHAERQAQYRARKKQKELEAIMELKASGKSSVKKKRFKSTLQMKHESNESRIGKVKVTSQSTSNIEDSSKFQPLTPIETIVIKPEPPDTTVFEQNLIYCRCCFKLLSNAEVQFPIDSAILKMFQNILQLVLEPSQIAPSFCEGCFNDIVSFSQFKELATLKQQKFYEIIKINTGDINLIHDLKLNVDPFSTEIKDEDYDERIVKEEFLSIEINGFESPNEVPNTINKYSSKCNETKKNIKRHLLPCESLKCDKCNYVAIRRSLLDQHMFKKHSQPRICNICGKPFINLERHKAAVHENISKWVCDLCGYICSSRTYVEFHMKSWHLEKKFKCVKCEYETFTQERLDKHLLIVHEEIKAKKVTRPEDLKCPECDKVFNSKNNVEMHIQRIHRKKRDFKCNNCHKSFFNGCELKQHQDNIHNKTKRVICEVCGKAFPSPRFLRKHMVRHNEPQYGCEICGMSFFYKSMVKRHIDNLHLNVFSHVCNICNKGFRDSQKLKLHNLKHANIKFHCFVLGCTSSTSRPDALRFHMKHNHSLSPNEQSEFLKKLEAYYIEVMNKG